MLVVPAIVYIQSAWIVKLDLQSCTSAGRCSMIFLPASFSVSLSLSLSFFYPIFDTYSSQVGDVQRVAGAGVAMMIHECEHHLCLAVALLRSLSQHLLCLQAICRQSCQPWRRILHVLPEAGVAVHKHAELHMRTHTRSITA